VITPYPPGGATDIIGRVVAQQLQARLGHPFVIENRAGAGGNIGAAAASRAKPDGYTLLMGALTSHSINSVLQPDMAKFNLGKDFAPVSILGTVPLVLVVHPSVPAQSVQELLAYAKAKPGEMKFASSGNASPQHLAGEMLRLVTGTDLLHVPYKGSGPALIDLVGGAVNMMIETAPAAVPQIKSGRLRPLMVAAAERAPALPDVPNSTEAGLPGYEVSSMFGLLAPAGTPRPIIDRLNAELATILALDEVKTKLAEQGVTPAHTTPEGAGERIRAEVAKWEKVIKDANVKIE
jgi:tripartite-type tricarboxylate transporter receptor subunit TctC